MSKEPEVANPANILIITTDQQRFDSLPVYGARFCIAPNLERLAAEGVVFDRCYVPSPICVPTRAAIMSGQFPSATGVIDNFSWLRSSTSKWTDTAREAGYKTAAVGKMHFAPWELMEGFGERVTCEDKRHFYVPDDHAHFLKERGIDRPHPKEMPGYFESCGAPDFPFQKELHPDVFIAERGAEWILKNARERFLLWVSFVGPHDPYDPPAEYSDLYADAAIPPPIPPPSDPAMTPSFRAQKLAQPGVANSVYRIDPTSATPEQVARWRRHYFGNITLIDEGVGKILTALESSGTLENTVIIFTSDHGDALGDHGMVFKSFFYESMVHVPLIICDGRATGRRSALVGTTDVVAYLQELIDIQDSTEGLAGAPGTVQGHSLASVLRDEGATIHDCVFSEMPGRMMAFDGRYKYIHAQDGDHELYDLEEDPQEMHNIVGHPSVANRVLDLSGRLLAHLMESARLSGSVNRAVAFPGRLEMEETYRKELSSRKELPE